MLKKQLTLLFVVVLAFQLTMVFAQQAYGEEPARVEGIILRSSQDKLSLSVRDPNSGATKTVVYDDSTKWVSQYHADKKVNDIDRSKVKDGDYVICTGTWGESGELKATMVSKRLSHSD